MKPGYPCPGGFFPPCALFFIGLALIVSLFGGRGRRGLIGLGVLALVTAVAVGVGAERYAGPVGGRTAVTGIGDWPVNELVSVGTVTIDLTRHPLPRIRSTAVGAGKIIVRIRQLGCA